MGLFEQFPYTNFHELNLNWCLQVAESAKEHLDGYDEDMAAIAQSKTDAENAAIAAAGSAASAAASAADTTQAQNAEAWAAGTKNGVAVGADAPQYHNNSKYWSDQAASSASDASGYANDASGYANDASGYADNAAAQVLEAEAWAEGEKAGVPVTSDDPQYNNNAKYWAGQASTLGAAAGAAAATPAAEAVTGDYSKFSIGACYQVTVRTGYVKADRTVIGVDGTSSTISVPGLVVFPSQISGYTTGGDDYNSDQARAVENRFVPIACWPTDTYDHFIVIPYEGPVAYQKVGSDFYHLCYARVWDLTSKAWAADNTAITFYAFITNAYNSTQILCNNDATIGSDLS